jgi:hypothetical protein
LLGRQVCVWRAHVAFAEAEAAEGVFDSGDAAGAGTAQQGAGLAEFRHRPGQVFALAVRGEDGGRLLRKQIPSHQDGTHVVRQRDRNVVVGAAHHIELGEFLDECGVPFGAAGGILDAGQIRIVLQVVEQLVRDRDGASARDVIQVDRNFRCFENLRIVFRQAFQARCFEVERRNAERPIGAIRSGVRQQLERFGKIRRAHLHDHAEAAPMLQRRLRDPLALSNRERRKLAGSPEHHHAIGAALFEERH